MVVHATSDMVLRGDVRWTGNYRRLPEVARIAHPASCPKGGYDVIAHHHRRLEGIAVWLVPVEQQGRGVGGKGQGDSSFGPIEETKCEFFPTISFVAPGATVTVTNHDPQPHWLIAEGPSLKRRQWYRAHDATVVRIPMGASDRIHLWSGFHRWMHAWVIAVDTPWHTTTDHQGQFLFKDVPPGEYVLHTWHPLLAEQTQIIAVPHRKHFVTLTYHELIEPTDPELRLAIPQMKEEWKRPRGDRPYR